MSSTCILELNEDEKIMTRPIIKVSLVHFYSIQLVDPTFFLVYANEPGFNQLIKKLI